MMPGGLNWAIDRAMDFFRLEPDEKRAPDPTNHD